MQFWNNATANFESSVRTKSVWVENAPMTKSSFRRNRLVLSLLLAGVALASFIPGGVSGAGKAAPAAKQEQTQAQGHLRIVRSANLGSTVVGVEIDGKQVAKINFGGSFETPLAAGPHVITVTPIPNREHGQPSQMQLNVKAGQSYTFTAKRSDVSLVLR